MNIQLAALSDLSTICELADQINTMHHCELPDLFTDPEKTVGSKEFWSKRLEDENSQVLVAKINNSVVGFISAKTTKNTEVPFCTNNLVCGINTIVVSKDHQNQGVGGDLMSAIENWAKKCGATSIRLEVMEFNKNARSFYDSNDYTVISRIMTKSIV